MKPVHFRWMGLGLLVMGVAATAVAAEPSLDPQTKLLAMRAAQADALRKLAERVYGLRIDANTTVRDFVAESDSIKTQVKAFLRGAKMVGRPRWYADGSCDVDYEMTLQTIITNLKRIAEGRIRHGRFKGDVFEQIRQHTRLTKITVTGSGAPRTDVDFGEDLGEGLATGVYREKMGRKIPAGWENVTPQGRLLAMRAAQVDAYRQIAERVIGVLVESDTEVKDFVTTEDYIRTLVRGRLVGVKVTGYRFMVDQVAECDVEMPLETIVTTLKRTVEGKIRHGRFKGDYFEEILRKRKISVIRATGRGVPPARFVRGTVSTVGVSEPPAWARRAIRATGSGAVDPAMLKENAAQAWLNAERAAQLDAMRKIAEEVNGLRIDATTTVKDFVAQHDEIRTDMQTYLRGCRVVARRRLEDGTAEVDVELPLERLWRIVSRVKK